MVALCSLRKSQGVEFLIVNMMLSKVNVESGLNIAMFALNSHLKLHCSK
jgi:hypothetical protein